MRPDVPAGVERCRRRSSGLGVSRGMLRAGVPELTNVVVTWVMCGEKIWNSRRGEEEEKEVTSGSVGKRWGAPWGGGEVGWIAMAGGEGGER